MFQETMNYILEYEKKYKRIIFFKLKIINKVNTRG